MNAYVYPGQGAQTESMAKELVTAFPPAASRYQAAKEITGLDLLSLSTEDLAQTRYSQLAIVVHSIGSLDRVLSESSSETAPSTASAGFSLGEYTALYAAGVVTYSDLLILINERARLMQLSAEKYPGAMYAVIGLSDQVVEETTSAFPDVYPVNYNCPGQVVIAGLAEVAEKAAGALSEKGARRVIKLSVNGAFHTPLMSDAAERLSEFAARLSFRPPLLPLYSNATAGKLSPEMDFPAYLALHMVSPVRFTEEIRAMRADGYTDFREVGPGNVLTGLIRKI